MLTISVSSEFSERVPQFRGAFLEATVQNSATSPKLWAEIEASCEKLQADFTTETIKSRSSIAATRAAYKACGKDPSRYRPASEQLSRRVLQGKGLYSVDTLVDLGNLVSIFSGYPTGLLDADKIVGKSVELGIGRADEPYEGIGRGRLNIEGLPVYRDAVGAIASPTSDSTRTMLSPTTQRLLFIINAYDGDEQLLQESIDLALDLLQRYAHADEARIVKF
jgi:putative B3/4 domain protein